jgi:hypothetical protein
MRKVSHKGDCESNTETMREWEIPQILGLAESRMNWRSDGNARDLSKYEPE